MFRFMLCSMLVIWLSVPCVSQTLKETYYLNTHEKAYSQAIAITGFDKEEYSFKALSASNINLITLTDENLPLSNDSSLNNDAWIVNFENVRLKLNRWTGSYIENQVVKSFAVFMDANSGCLIKIQGRSDTTKEFFYDKFGKESIKKVLDGSSEDWLSLPDSIPPVTFEMALQGAVASNPILAKEINAFCINYSELGREPKLVWMITGNDLPIGEHEVRPIHRMRCIIDAKSGKLLAFTTSL